MRETGLSVRGLGATLGGRAVVRVGALDLPPGQTLALMGPNGSGKSSLLRALGALLPSAGSVRLHGVELAALTPVARASRVACLLQRHRVAFDFTLAELVGLGLQHTDRVAVNRALEQVGLEGLGARRWSRCSGGEQQRAHLARALVTGADLLLLDEPDNHLDLGARALLAERIQAERARGAVLVLATHDLELASRCDQLLLLDRGREVLRGPPQALLGDPLFYSTFGLATPDARQATRPRLVTQPLPRRFQ